MQTSEQRALFSGGQEKDGALNHGRADLKMEDAALKRAICLLSFLKPACLHTPI